MNSWLKDMFCRYRVYSDLRRDSTLVFVGLDLFEWFQRIWVPTHPCSGESGGSVGVGESDYVRIDRWS